MLLSEVGQLTVNEMELEVGKGAVTVQMKLLGQPEFTQCSLEPLYLRLLPL